MNGTWAIVVAALGSSFLTIVGSFWLESWRVSRGNKRSADDRTRQACTQLVAHTMAFILRTQALHLTSLIRSGLSEGLDVALHVRKPIEHMDLIDWLLIDLQPMLEAQSIIEVTGEIELIRACNEVIIGATKVLEISTRPNNVQAQRNHKRITSLITLMQRLIQLKSNSEAELAIQQVIRELGKKLNQFAYITRVHLGVNDPDAILHTFPELFAED